MSVDDPIGHLIEAARGLGDEAFVELIEPGRPRPGDLVSIADLAAELGVSVRTLRRWNTSAEAPRRFRRRRQLMYRRADVAEWVKRMRGSGRAGGGVGKPDKAG